MKCIFKPICVLNININDCLILRWIDREGRFEAISATYGRKDDVLDLDGKVVADKWSY